MGAVARAKRDTDAARADQQARPDVKSVRELVHDCEQQFARALPQHVTIDRFMRAAFTALQTVKHLPECEPKSVLAGLMQAAQLGLEVSDVRGQAFLIPRWDGRDKVYRATFQLGYRGMIDLAARAGITVDVDTIHEHDQFDFQRGDEPRLYHKPTLDEPGEPVAYYAVAHFADGRRPQFVIRSRRQIELHRDRFASTRDNAGKVFGPWVDHFDGMAVKTVIRMLLDKLPTSAELRHAVVEDQHAERGEPPIAATYGPAAFADPVGAIEATATDADQSADETDSNDGEQSAG